MDLNNWEFGPLLLARNDVLVKHHAFLASLHLMHSIEEQVGLKPSVTVGGTIPLQASMVPATNTSLWTSLIVARTDVLLKHQVFFESVHHMRIIETRLGVQPTVVVGMTAPTDMEIANGARPATSTLEFIPPSVVQPATYVKTLLDFNAVPEKSAAAITFPPVTTTVVPPTAIVPKTEEQKQKERDTAASLPRKRGRPSLGNAAKSACVPKSEERRKRDSESCQDSITRRKRFGDVIMTQSFIDLPPAVYPKPGEMTRFHCGPGHNARVDYRPGYVVEVRCWGSAPFAFEFCRSDIEILKVHSCRSSKIGICFVPDGFESVSAYFGVQWICRTRVNPLTARTNPEYMFELDSSSLTTRPKPGSEPVVIKSQWSKSASGAWTTVIRKYMKYLDDSGEAKPKGRSNRSGRMFSGISFETVQARVREVFFDQLDPIVREMEKVDKEYVKSLAVEKAKAAIKAAEEAVQHTTSEVVAVVDVTDEAASPKEVGSNKWIKLGQEHSSSPEVDSEEDEYSESDVVTDRVAIRHIPFALH